jgi:hypothetical protein
MLFTVNRSGESQMNIRNVRYNFSYTKEGSDMKRRLVGGSPASMTTLPLRTTVDRSNRRQRKGPQSLPLLVFFVCISLFCILCIRKWLTGSGDGLLASQQTTRLPFYIPRADVDAEAWDWPLIHIVNTRFMQEQGNLTALGNARLALFKVFCLPTMQRQSKQDFLWIIKTDPNLHPTLLQALVDELTPHPNFYLVASNTNFRVNEQFPGAWRDGAEVRDLAQSKVYTGNQSLLERAMALHHPSDPYPILETRLDADDGLHLQFLESIQAMALKSFGDHPTLKWRYWCSRRHVEWHFSERELENKPIWKQITTYGALAGIQHSKLCITPGISIGFGVGVSEQDVPVFAHDELRNKIYELPLDEACGLKKSRDCLQFVEDFVFEAIRSRSPTSAGMYKVDVNPNEVATDGWLYYAFLNMIHEKFGIPLQNLKWINQYISDHLLEIAEENLMGQCTTGHSCKVRVLRLAAMRYFMFLIN